MLLAFISYTNHNLVEALLGNGVLQNGRFFLGTIPNSTN